MTTAFGVNFSCSLVCSDSGVDEEIYSYVILEDRSASLLI